MTSELEGMFLFAEMGCRRLPWPPLFESETLRIATCPRSTGLWTEGRGEITGLEEDHGHVSNSDAAEHLRQQALFPQRRGQATSRTPFATSSSRAGMPFTDEDVRLIEAFIAKALRDDSRMADTSRERCQAACLRRSIDRSSRGADSVDQKPAFDQ